MKRATLLLALLLAGTASAAATAERVIGRKTATGDYAIALATGAAAKPLELRVRTAATPTQPVQVSWMVVCTKGTSAGSRQGAYRVTAGTATRLLRLPMTRPSRCTVSASAQLDTGGKIAVTLLAR